MMDMSTLQTHTLQPHISVPMDKFSEKLFLVGAYFGMFCDLSFWYLHWKHALTTEKWSCWNVSIMNYLLHSPLNRTQSQWSKDYVFLIVQCTIKDTFIFASPRCIRSDLFDDDVPPYSAPFENALCNISQTKSKNFT